MTFILRISVRKRNVRHKPVAQCRQSSKGLNWRLDARSERDLVSSYRTRSHEGKGWHWWRRRWWRWYSIRIRHDACDPREKYAPASWRSVSVLSAAAILLGIDQLPGSRATSPPVSGITPRLAVARRYGKLRQTGCCVSLCWRSDPPRILSRKTVCAKHRVSIYRQFFTTFLSFSWYYLMNFNKLVNNTLCECVRMCVCVCVYGVTATAGSRVDGSSSIIASVSFPAALPLVETKILIVGLLGFPQHCSVFSPYWT